MIGTIRQSKSIIGIRLYDTNSGVFKDVPIQSVVAVLSKGAKIANLDVQGGQLTGTNGSLGRYPTIVNGRLMGNSPLIILNEVGDLGYDVVDWKGTKARYKKEDVVAYSEKNGIANGKVVEKDGRKFISSISGNYDRVELPLTKKAETTVKSENVANIKREEVKNPTQKPETTNKTPMTQSSDINSLPADVRTVSNKRFENVDNTSKATSGSNTLDVDKTGYRPPVISVRKPDDAGNKLVDEKLNMTVEQKLSRAVLVLKNIDRFLYSLYISLTRVPVMDPNICPTMGVSIDTIYYNCEFVRGLSMPELVFILEHEMYHIAMRHNSRRGTRHATVWNMAADFYINKMICEEYGIEPGMAPKIPADDTLGVGIQFAEGGLYSKFTNTQIETAESIYDELMDQYNKMKKKQRQQNGTDEQGNKQGEQSQGNSGQEHQEQQQGQGGQGQQGQGQQQQGNGQGNGQQRQDQQQNGQGQDGHDQGGQDQDKDIKDVVADLVYHGQKVGRIGDFSDIFQSEENESLSSELQAAKESSILKRALSHAKRIGGHDKSAIERMVEDALAPRVDWKSILRSYLVKATQKLNTFSKPDKRFISRGMIMPGPKALDPDKLHGVKVCIDTSGSISDEELSIAIAQILQLLRTYKAEAEMIYWDTAVRKVAPFKDKRELLRIKPAGGGGTDVSCVFDYFDSKECKIKPTVTIIFTDGCFLKPQNSKWARKYKDTIWIISGGRHSAKTFDKPWGKVADFKG